MQYPIGVLYPRINADQKTFATAASLQRHTEWVSQAAADIPGLLQAAGFSLVGEVMQPSGSFGQSYVAKRNHQAVVSFRGTVDANSMKNTIGGALIDGQIIRVRPKKLLAGALLKVHTGFYHDYLRFQDDIHSRLDSLSGITEIYVTGFSLGAALGTLAALDLTDSYAEQTVTAILLGTPRVGNKRFHTRCHELGLEVLRVVCATDPVPRVPLHVSNLLGFNHLGKLLEMDLDGTPKTPENVDGRLLDHAFDLKDHNRDKYRDMIASFRAKFTADPSILSGPDPLGALAVGEANSVAALAKDDTNEGGDQGA